MAGLVNLSKPALAKFRVEYAPGRGYFVVNPEGQRASGFDMSEDRALATCESLQSKSDAEKKRRERPCLRCGTAFMSEGVHNRMCNRCRNCASNDEATPFSFGAIHGRKRA